MPKRSVVVLKSHPSGEPKDEDFEVKEQEVGELAGGSVRIEPTHFSVDPYLRGKMSGKTGFYFVPFKLGEPIDSFGVGKIVESKSDKHKVGDLVVAGFEWATLVDVKPDAGFFQTIQLGVEPETALSVLGLTGLTAYYGLLHIGKLDEKKAGSTVFVSGAAGATGNVVGQIAKIKGYRVIATAGSDDKVAWLKDELHFDEVINYKTVPNFKEALKAAAPDGVDLYFDNVGGEIFDAAIEIMNNYGVIVCCGAISGYNAKEELTGPRVEWRIITKSLRLQGFIVTEFFSNTEGVGAASKELFGWVKEGKLKEKVTIFDDVSGVGGIYKGFIRMMKGDNTGKSIVKI